MRNLYKAFLEENITNEYLNEKFNYDFDNKKCDKQQFIIEYKKFLGIYNGLFYYEDRFVTVFNSYEIRINIDELDQLMKLYLYSEENELKNEMYVLLDFLYTYNNTINSNSYKTNYARYNDSKKDFENILNKYNLKKDFYTQSINILYQFYKNLIEYALENAIYIDSELINKIFNNLRKKEEYCNELIEIFIVNNKNICNIVKFDNEKEKHLDIYLKYINDSLDRFCGYNYAKEIFFELEKSECLNDEFTRKVINRYIDVVNKTYDRLKDKNYSFIRGISEIENIKNELNYILKNIKSLTEKQKDKIKECLKKILYLKRLLVSDDEYLKMEMHRASFQEKVKKEDIEKCKKSLLSNEYLLYSASMLDFSKQIESALKLYAKYPIQSVIPSYKIDSAKNIYSVGIEEKKKLDNDNFKKYFDQKGREYTEKHKNLMNKLSKDYYEELLKYLSKTFIMQQHLIILSIGNGNLKKIINKLKMSTRYDCNNDYAIVIRNILAIESNIVKFMKKNGLIDKKNGFYNINDLISIFTEDKDVVNGLMYLNYTLYEKSGLNLRNYMMHGTLINTNLDIPLMVTFSGLIFVSWLLNSK